MIVEPTTVSVFGQALAEADQPLRLAGRPQQPNRFALELRGESLSLLHRTPPCEDCPRILVSEKSVVV
ncbi:MAG: hypothetical protein ACTHK2_17260 [Dokdonella sp.]|uniref:hypothetical protein n=1 Tax=Dokdonella sp. TaxID=2291710 RepID=UPI003F7F13CD